MDVKFNCLEAKVVPIDMVQANNYNPNHCAKDKMELLKQSIIDNGLCYAVTVIWSEEDEKYIIVDGFHRYSVVKDYLGMKEIPVVVLEHNLVKEWRQQYNLIKLVAFTPWTVMLKLSVALLNRG